MKKIYNVGIVECYGLQFCFTLFDGVMNAIELSTGFCSDFVPIKSGSYKELEEKISSRTKDTYDKALLMAKKILKKKGRLFLLIRKLTTYKNLNYANK